MSSLCKIQPVKSDKPDCCFLPFGQGFPYISDILPRECGKKRRFRAGIFSQFARIQMIFSSNWRFFAQDFSANATNPRDLTITRIYMAETERFEKQSFDFLHLFLCYSVLFSSSSRFLSTYSTYSFGCFYRDCCHVAVSPSGFPLGLLTFIPV